MTEAKPRVGFIGLGVMGAPMAGHLGRAGHAVALHDVASGRAAEVAQGIAQATACATPREVAQQSDILVTMLPNGRVVQEVLFGAEGAAAALRPGALLLDTSSSEPWLTRATAGRLAATGVAMVDAPVSGAVQGATAGELVFMVGASAEDLARVRPLLEAMGRRVFHLGGVGAGHTMKCLNNLITAITLTATAEGLAIGTRAGLDPAVMTDVLDESTGGSWITRTHIRERVLSRRFDDPFKLELMLKDMGIAIDLARELALPAPLSSAGHQLWQAAGLAQGEGASVSAIVQWVEAQMQVEIRTPAAAIAAPRRPENVYERYHAHVYFDAQTIDRARALCERVAAECAVAMGRVHERAVGPHPFWSCQLAFDRAQFDAVIGRLEKERQGLNVFVHGLTGNDYADHTDHAMWLGDAAVLDLAMFRPRAGRAEAQ